MILLSELDIAARTLWGEARGEDDIGRRAVAYVFLNRWKTTHGQFRKDDTLATACLRHVQFSVWNAGDPNFKKMFQIDYNNVDLRVCLQILLEVINEDGKGDFTDGARHYYSKSMHIAPDWAVGHTPSYETNGHIFFNDVD